MLKFQNTIKIINIFVMIKKIFRLLKNPHLYLENLQSRFVNKNKTKLLHEAKNFLSKRDIQNIFHQALKLKLNLII